MGFCLTGAGAVHQHSVEVRYAVVFMIAQDEREP
jgi:hypothetical protein